MNKKIFIYILFLFVGNLFAQNTPFTVVIDAGHGGRDPGALGAISQEKKINLDVALKLGNLIEKNHKDVKVLYTRKNDTYLTVFERAELANKNKANLFISIHANATKDKKVCGTETFVFGLSKSKSNLDVAMRENSVILLEDDYKTRYEGFDPTSVESYIMFEFMQNKYMERSVWFASNIQDKFTNDCKRGNRGVKESELIVLHRSACPGVLVELGFITNPAEEKYMASAKGQNELAAAISNAFDAYKRDYDKKSGITTVTSNGATNNNKDKPVFKVQVAASKTELKTNDKTFKGVRNIDVYIEGGVYKYTTGDTTDYNKIVKTKNSLQSKFPDAFIIAFLGDRKIPVNEAKAISEK
ncbi:N-acetylmuramoyl-L-alanine amidase [Paludibacter sp. 221]|nr:N-acetylmuramoyl-L-alanine amidase [Paludibacter sp. 221]